MKKEELAGEWEINVSVAQPKCSKFTVDRNLQGFPLTLNWLEGKEKLCAVSETFSCSSLTCVAVSWPAS